MASPDPDRDTQPSGAHDTPPGSRRRLGSMSPAELAASAKEGTTRDTVWRELRLWLVAAISAGAGALGMYLSDGSWLVSIAMFAVVFLVAFFIRAQYERKVTERRAAALADRIAADQAARREAAEERQRQAAEQHRQSQHRPHKPRSNPYRRKKSE